MRSQRGGGLEETGYGKQKKKSQRGERHTPGKHWRHQREYAAHSTCLTDTCRKKWKKGRNKSHNLIKTWHLFQASRLALFSLNPLTWCLGKTRGKESRKENANTSPATFGVHEACMPCHPAGSGDHMHGLWLCLPMWLGCYNEEYRVKIGITETEK